MYGLKDSDVEIILGVLAKYSDVEKAVIYGSRAMDNYKHGSDVDIAIYSEQRANIEFKIAGELNEETLLPFKFDVIDFAKIKEPALKEQIERHGVIIFSKWLK